jgi:hypothetical protein
MFFPKYLVLTAGLLTLASTYQVAARKQLKSVVNGITAQHYVDVHIGATPGISTSMLLHPQAKTTVLAYAPQQSQFRENYTDLLYIRDSVARVSFEEQESGQQVLGGDALSAFGAPWGVCDNVLYFGVMPRKCYKGTFVQLTCSIEQCPISFLRTQHVVRTCSDPLMLGPDVVVLDTPCDRRITVKDTDLPAALHSPGSQQTTVSLWQLGASVQYNPNTLQMSVWVRDTTAGRIESVATVGILVAFLSVWLTWTSDLNNAIFNQTPDMLEATWAQVAAGAMLAFDAVTFSGSIKAWYLFSDADVFTPPAVDITYGNTFSKWYCLCYVVTALLFVTIAAIILSIMSATHGDWLPQFILSWVNPGIWYVRGNPGKAKPTMPREKSVLLVMLRWIVEVLVLTALHIAIPTHLGQSYQTAVGLGVGLALALIAGRDIYIVVHETLASNRPLFRSSTVVLGFFGLAYTITHVAIFMVLPTFVSAETLTTPMCVACSWSLTIQTACLGVVLCKQAYAGGRATNALV